MKKKHKKEQKPQAPIQERPTTSKKFYRYILLCLLIIGIAVYANSLRSPFLWDDPYLIIDNHFIKSFKYLPQIFTHHLYYSTAGTSNFYRPLQTLFLMVEYSIWKLNPFGYHLTSILCHIICAYLIFLIVEFLSRKKGIAFMVSLLFLVHPVNTRVVDYISNRADSQATLFILLSFLMFFKSLSKAAKVSIFYYVVSLASFILALLSKELAIIYPFLILVSICINSGKDRFLRPSALKKTIPLFIILAVYGTLRMTVLNFPMSGSGSPPSLYIRLLTSSRSFVKLIGLLFFPYPVHIEESIPFARGFFEPRIFSSIVILLAIGIFIIRIRRFSRMCLWGLVWFFVSLLPMSNIVPINATMVSYWLYLPCLGVFVGTLGLVDDILSRIDLNRQDLFRKPLISFYSIVIIIFSILTIKQNTIWNDPLKFYQTAIKYSPDSYRPHNEIGIIYLQQGKYDLAIKELQKAIELNKRFELAYDNLGMAYDHKGDFENAIPQYKKAIELNPLNPKTYNNLGNAYNKLNQFDQAIKAYEEALKLNPHYKAVYNNLGVIYYKKGIYEEAKKYWGKALEIDPNFDMAIDNLKVLQGILDSKK